MNNIILYIEDDPDFVAIYSKFLQEKDYQVICAEDGKTALEEYRQIHPDLILLDINLSDGSSGYDVATEIRKTDKMTPIIFFTSLLGPEDAIKGYETGANDYIRKGISPTEMMAKLKVWLSNSSIQGARINITERTYIDRAQSELCCCGKTEPLTFNEMNLLSYFVIHKNVIQDRELLSSYIWGNDKRGRNGMDKCLFRLRKLLENDTAITIYSHKGGLVGLYIR